VQQHSPAVAPRGVSRYASPVVVQNVGQVNVGQVNVGPHQLNIAAD
jgi:hypothetical protein